MHWDLYLRLSGLMFLEFAVWGAWMPVLALRLLGPLKMTGKQTGWIYATFPLACIFAPIASGYMADKWLNAEWIILISHLIGAVLLYATARQTKFWGVFWVMLIYCVFFTGTLPLVNNMLLQQLGPIQKTWVLLSSPSDGSPLIMITETAMVFFWAPVAWALIGYFLTGLRKLRKAGGDGPDSLYLAAILSLIMVAVCLCQIPLKPASKGGNPIVDALAMLKNANYLIFILTQMAVSGMMQFYFLGTGQFMQDKGVKGRNVSAAMAIAQAVQAIATILLLGWFLDKVGFQWTFAVGALCWTALYAVYVTSKSTLWIVLLQAFHGLAYVLFMIAGQIFVSKMAPEAIGASAQSLIFIATTGVGLFLGTQLAGFVMDKNSVGGKFQWSKIWMVPLAITLAGAIVFAVVFKMPSPDDFKKDVPPAKSVTLVQL